MSRPEPVLFTGERLHAGSTLFGVDLARHRAAYAYALRLGASAPRVLDLGCGSGYGTAELARGLAHVVGIDRVWPDPAAREDGAHYLLADLRGLPLAGDTFDLVVSFQVIEHLEDPAPYLHAIRHLVRPGGTAIITTPNLLTSDRVNPYHVHEYEAQELRQVLLEYFGEVEMCGVHAGPAVARYFEERLERIRRILRQHGARTMCFGE